jgi:enoyl-CoA hydratase/carnithine racemase
VIRVDRPASGVLAVYLDRPAKRNAVNAGMLEALHRAFAEDARVVVLGSTDPACFCAGADLSLTPDARAALSEGLYELYERMLTLCAPVLAAIAGPAIGGGAQLAIAADLRFAGPGARFRFPGPANGITVGAWGLPSLVGRGRAFDLAATMRDVDAEEAARIGLIDRLVDDPLAAALDTGAALATSPAAVIAATKRIAVEGAGLVEALRAERAANREHRRDASNG